MERREDGRRVDEAREEGPKHASLNKKQCKEYTLGPTSEKAQTEQIIRKHFFFVILRIWGDVFDFCDV